MYVPFLLSPFYWVWNFIYRLFSFFDRRLEKLYFFYNPDHVGWGVSFYETSPFFKLWAVYFYRIGNYKWFAFLVTDLNNVIHIRTVNHPLAHTLFAEFAAHNFNEYLPNYIAYNVYSEAVQKYLPSNDECITAEFNNFLILLSSSIDENYEDFYFNGYTEAPLKMQRLCFEFVLDIVDTVASNKIYVVTSFTTVKGFFRLLGSTDSLTLYKKSYKFKKSIIRKTLPTKILTKNILKMRKPNLQVYLQYAKFYNNKLEKKYVKFFAPYYLYSELIKKINRRVTIVNYFKIEMQRYFKIKYRPSDVTQYLNLHKIKQYTILYIRKNKIFNKGRYSRNRQLYRTGVYWCIWVNVLAVFGLYFYFYRFTFNFGYLWWPLFVLVLSVFGNRLVKYRFYNYKNIINEILAIQKILTSLFIHIKGQTIPFLYNCAKLCWLFITEIPKIIYIFVIRVFTKL